MDIPIDRKYNLKILAMIAPHIKDLEYCIFFGTLLGYQREGNLLEKDDDVDIYLNIKHRDELLDVLSSLSVKIIFKKPTFIQCSINRDNTQIYLDIYLYSIQGNYVIDPWNFGGCPDQPETDLHIPIYYLFPTKKGNIGDIYFKVPNAPERCCKFLYGEDYMTPKKKKEDYFTRIVDHKPKLFKFDPEAPTSILPKKKKNMWKCWFAKT